MLQTERDFDLLFQQCRHAVAGFIDRHGWQLLEQEDFVQRVFSLVSSDQIADPRRAAVHIYCQALYAACSGDEGAQRQNLAYTELFRYLYDLARRRYPHVAADAAQQALERVFESFDRCHEPGTFLAFAFQQLRDAARKLLRQEQQHPQSLDALRKGSESLGEHLADQRQPELSLMVIADEIRQRFKSLMAAFLQAHPRAEDQIAALQLKYIEGLDDTTISQRLGVSVNSVYVLRSRAIKRLQSDRHWRALAAELGIVSDVSEG